MTKKYFPPPNWPPAPPGWTPPPGWQPDPKWGPPPHNWMLWREDQSWFSRHKVVTGVGGGGLALLLLLGTIGNADNNTTTAGAGSPSVSTTSTPTPSAGISSPASAPEPAVTAVSPSPAPPTNSVSERPPEPSPPTSEYGNYPSAERDFITAVEQAQDDASDADNDLQYGAALSHRNKKLCKIVGNGKAQKWVGKVSTLDSNGDGFGVLAVAIGDTAAVGTWNNALSDYEDNTLIKPGDLLDKLLTLEEGQQVEFSGRFIRQSGTCVNDKRLTKVGKIDDPEFVFKFSSVKEIS